MRVGRYSEPANWPCPIPLSSQVSDYSSKLQKLAMARAQVILSSHLLLGHDSICNSWGLSGSISSGFGRQLDIKQRVCLWVSLVPFQNFLQKPKKVPFNWVHFKNNKIHWNVVAAVILHWPVKAETHDATNRCYTSPRQVAATNRLVWHVKIIVAAICRMNSNWFEFVRHIAATN